MKKLLLLVMVLAVLALGVQASFVGNLEWQNNQNIITINRGQSVDLISEIVRGNGETGVSARFYLDTDLDRSNYLTRSPWSSVSFFGSNIALKQFTIIPDDYNNQPGTYYVHVRSTGSLGVDQSIETLILIVVQPVCPNNGCTGVEFSCPTLDSSLICIDLNNDGYYERYTSNCAAGYTCNDIGPNDMGIIGNLIWRLAYTSVNPPSMCEVDVDGDDIPDPHDTQICGNSIIESPEVCDNSAVSHGTCDMSGGDACTIDCSAGYEVSGNQCVLICGNGVCGAGENDNNCPVDCNPVCGNSVIEAGELCDNSAVTNGVCDMTSPDACTIDCSAGYEVSGNQCVLICGNGVCGAGENDNNCPVDCNPVCGNSVIEAGELCDNSAVTNGVCDMTSPDACTIDCSAGYEVSGNQCVLICGNGVC